MCCAELVGPAVRRGLVAGGIRALVAWGVECEDCGWCAVGYGPTAWVASSELEKQINQARRDAGNRR